MGTSYEALHNLLRSIEGDSTIALESQLPSFNTLCGRAWSTPLVFLYRGDAWPTVIYPWHLCEMSRTCFPMTSDVLQAVMWPCPQTLVDGERGGSAVLDGTHVVQASRFELVGTAFTIERYQIFSQGHTHSKHPSLNPECSRPVGSVVLRVITNENGVLLDERTAAHRLAQLHEKQIRHIFLRTSTPLLGATVGQIERKCCSSGITAGVSHSDSESGGVSSIAHSSHGTNEEASIIIPDVHLEPPHPDASSRPVVSPSDRRPSNNTPPDMDNASSMPFVGLVGLAHTDLALRWDVLRNMFDQEEKYHVDVVGAWARWTDGWDEVSRFAVVNSIDDIITSLDGSREAAHVAVAYLDMFLYASQKAVLDPTYFSGVLLACAMLGCKQVDRFFPSVKSFLRCLPPESRITEEEFLRYEMHVLRVLEFRLQQVTSLEVVETLLHLCSSAAIQRRAEAQHRQRELKRWGSSVCSNEQMGGSIDALTQADSLRWEDMCKLTRFFNDIVVRNTVAQAFRPTVLGLAILVVAAEKASWALPLPLLDVLPEPFRTNASAAAAAAQVELDDDSCELLVRYTAIMKCRDEQEASMALKKSSLHSAIEVVRGCCKECMLHPLDGVLRRRYNIGCPIRW